MNRPGADRFEPCCRRVEESHGFMAGRVRLPPYIQLFPQHLWRSGRLVLAPPVNAAMIADGDHDGRRHFKHASSNELVAGRGVALFKCGEIPIELAAVS